MASSCSKFTICDLYRQSPVVHQRTEPLRTNHTNTNTSVSEKKGYIPIEDGHHVGMWLLALCLWGLCLLVPGLQISLVFQKLVALLQPLGLRLLLHSRHKPNRLSKPRQCNK